MTKAEQIMALYPQYMERMAEPQVPRAIAEDIGTTDSYVRTVVRQRKGTGKCDAERRYLASPLGKSTIKRLRKARYERDKTDPAWREKRREKSLAYYEKKTKENYAAFAAARRERYLANVEWYRAYQRDYSRRKKDESAKALGDA